MTSDEIVERLEEAGRTLLSLPPERAQGHMRVAVWDYVREMVHSMAIPSKARPTPTPREIDRMDEALSWLGLIPCDQFVLRRIVCARLLVSPLTGKHFYAWRRIATKIGADHKAVQRWHAQGIDTIAGKLRAAQGGRRHTHAERAAAYA